MSEFIQTVFMNMSITLFIFCALDLFLTSIVMSIYGFIEDKDEYIKWVPWIGYYIGIRTLERIDRVVEPDAEDSMRLSWENIVNDDGITEGEGKAAWVGVLIMYAFLAGVFMVPYVNVILFITIMSIRPLTIMIFKARDYRRKVKAPLKAWEMIEGAK